MSDMWHLPQGYTAVKVERFYNLGSGSAPWVPYNLPRGCSQVLMIGMGAGSGGGAGFGRASTFDGGGGGGGGSGAMTRCLFSRNVLPDTVYVNIGTGGSGGIDAGDVNPTAGEATYVSAYPSQSAIHLFLIANGGQGNAFNGDGVNAVGAGTGGNASAATAMQLVSSGNWTSVAGQSGGSGSLATTNGAGGAVTWGGSGIICSGGCGGSSSTGTDFNGARINGGGLFPSIAQPGIGNPGHCGYVMTRPFMTCGGGGGPSTDASAGMVGGDGAFGSGGGGGGAGAPANSGGTGGRGGDGLALIVCW